MELLKERKKPNKVLLRLVGNNHPGDCSIMRGDKDRNLSNPQTVSNMSEERLWKQLDRMDSKLDNIDDSLEGLVKIEADVGHMRRDVARLDANTQRNADYIHELQMDQQHMKTEQMSLIRRVGVLEQNSEDVKGKVSNNKSVSDKNEGHKEFGVGLLKVIVAFLTGYFLWLITKK